MTKAKPKAETVAAEISPDSVQTFNDPDEGTSLADHPRQRTAVESHEVAQPQEAGANPDCDNHPGVKAVETSDGGGAHQPQSFCEECLAKNAPKHR